MARRFNACSNRNRILLEHAPPYLLHRPVLCPSQLRKEGGLLRQTLLKGNIVNLTKLDAMHARERFYVNAYGPDDAAFARLIQSAIATEHRLSGVSRIVFIGHSLKNDGWLQRQYGHDAVKKLKEGSVRLPSSKVPAKFESLNNYKTVKGEIMVTMGLGSDEILLLEDNFEIKAVFALPWNKEDVVKWSRVTAAVNVDGNDIPAAFDEVPCVVREALTDLSESINNSTGLMHSADNELAKTYLRALSKNGYLLEEEAIESYLIKEHNWNKEHADQLLEIVKKINSGKSFHGGDKTALKYHIDRWKKTCKEA